MKKLYSLVALEYTRDPLYQSYIVKSIRCESGKVYTTNGFKLAWPYRNPDRKSLLHGKVFCLGGRKQKATGDKTGGKFFAFLRFPPSREWRNRF